MTNIILKCFKNNGDETILEDCDYFQLKLLGDHAITKDAIVLVSKKCLPHILIYKWYLDKNGYAISYGKTRIKMHRLIYTNYKGLIQDKYVIDHINRDRLDNRLENLRQCSQKENSYNTSKHMKYKGVNKTKTGWNARITKDGKVHMINNIKSEKDAALIYDMMAEELFGEYAGKNYTDDLSFK